jgi:hypothetical protein
MDQAPFDPRRRLCRDGTCVGVIGPDGRCKECGLPADGRAPEGASAAADAPDADGASADTETDAPADADTDDRLDAAPSDDGGGGRFDPSRKLCEDEGCIGVLGADGVCPVCGRRAGA